MGVITNRNKTSYSFFIVRVSEELLFFPPEFLVRGFFFPRREISSRHKFRTACFDRNLIPLFSFITVSLCSICLMSGRRDFKNGSVFRRYCKW